MIGRLTTYLAAFTVAFLVWLGLSILEIMTPLLPWKFTLLGFVMGWSFPGGASLELYFISHFFETWMPFVIAFLIACLFTKGRAKALGALAMYAIFLGWSFALAAMAEAGAALPLVYAVGFAGTFLGGLGLYLLLVDPRHAAGAVGEGVI